MKTNSRKILSLLLAAIMVISVIPLTGITAFADASGDEQYETFGEWEYNIISEDTVEIAGYLGTKTNIEIPSVINGYAVTGISYSAFYNHTSLTSVTIPESVTSIGASAFKNCSSLEKITISNSVTSIDYNAFDDTAYYNTESNWENDVLYIGNHLIAAKNTISGEYNIKEGIKTIAGNAFYGCTLLTGIKIPDSVMTIGSSAFCDCTSLTNITIPTGIKEIYYDVFSGCTSLESITIPDSVTSIGAYAFYGCTSLKSIAIPKGVTEIYYSTFSDCTSLKSITIPDSVTKIEGSAFDNTAYYNNEANWENDVLYIGNHLIAAKNTISGEYNIKEGIKTIAGSAFYGCTLLTGIKIPDSVISIGGYAFYDCTLLENIVISDSVTSIGCCAFENTAYCNNDWKNDLHYVGNHLVKTSVLSGDYEIKEGTKTIADEAFFGCDDSLTSVTIPKSVTNIGDGAFLGCDNLKIYGYSGSYAETYAKEHNIQFSALQPIPSTDAGCDINGDGITDAADAVMIQRYDAGIITLTSEQLSAGDVNGDGIVDAADAVKIQRYDAGLIDSL